MSSVLAVEDIDHSCTKTKSQQTNDICARFHKTVLQEVYRSIEELWLQDYNESRPH